MVNNKYTYPRPNMSISSFRASINHELTIETYKTNFYCSQYSSLKIVNLIMIIISII